MAYIGNTVQNQGFAPAVDYFNGDGTTVTFTLSRPVASVAQLTAVIENVIQNPSTAFTVSGSSITFTSAPPSGTNNIWVEYTSLITTYAAISQDPTVIGDITATGGYSATGDYGNSFVDGVILDYVTGNARITTGASDGITLYNGGTASRSALMSITSAGNVGIGTSSPYRQFQVGNYSTNATMALGSISSGYSTICFATADSAPGRYIGLIEYGHSANYMGFTTNGTERMRIDTSGNVGIGTSSPTQKLDVSGTVQSQYNAATNDAVVGSYNFYNTNSSASSNPIRASIVAGRENSAWGAYLQFNTSTGTSAVTERMRIDTSGRVLMPYQPSFWVNTAGCTRNGTTGIVQGYPTPFFNVGNAFNATTGYFTAPVAGLYAFYGQKYNNNNPAGIIHLEVNNVQKVYGDFSGSGNFHIAATLYYKLAVGDTVGMYISSSMNAADGNDYFGGYLVG